MFRGVTGSRDRLEGQSSEVERLAAIETVVWEREVRGASANDGRTDRR